LFAAVALHKFLAGMDQPEEHFSQIADSYEEVCEQAWDVAMRMVRVRRQLRENEKSLEASEDPEE
jgi:tRNA A-37 threonylcarbamoyl transferase component Bud32